MNTLTGITHTIGKKIIIPAPNNSDTWEVKMRSLVDDLQTNGIITFYDTNSKKHKISIDRVKFL